MPRGVDLEAPDRRSSRKIPFSRRRRRVIGYLLDTNVISEIVRGAPHPGVVTFLAEHEDLWLSSIVVHELEYGVRRVPQGQRRTHLQASLLRLTTEYDDRILPLDRTSAEWAAQFRAQAQHAGLTLDLAMR